MGNSLVRIVQAPATPLTRDDVLASVQGGMELAPRVPGLFLTDSTRLHPSERTISGMFGQAQKVAALIEKVP